MSNAFRNRVVIALFSLVFMSLPTAFIRASANNIDDLQKHANDLAGKNPEQAVRYLWQARHEADNSKNIAIQAKSLRLLGEFYLSLFNFDSASYYTAEALKKAENSGDKKEMGDCYIAKANLSLEVKNTFLAQKYLDMAQPLFAGLHDDEGIAGAMFVQGNIYLKEAKYEEAIKNYNKILAEPKDTSLSFIDLLYNNIGLAYNRMHQADMAIPVLNKLLKRAHATGNEKDEAGAMINLGSAYLQLNKIDTAESFLNLALQIGQRLNNPKILMGAFSSLKFVAIARNDYKSALDWYRNEMTARDSVFSLEEDRHIAGLEAQYQATIEAEKKAELQKQKNYAIAGALLFILIAVVLIVLLRRISTQKKTVTLEKERSEQLGIVKDKLFSIISHDLRAPLSSTQSLMQLLDSDALTYEEAKPYYAKLGDAIQQNIQLLDNLLYWAANQVKGLEIRKKKLNMSEIIEESVHITRAAADKKNISVYEKHQPGTIAYADINMVRLILRNLMSNAVKYTPAGGTITISSTVSKNMVFVAVSDTGMGLNTATKALIFSENMPESMPGTQAERGFGIGLKLCKEFAIKNGGDISVESEPNQGSTFTFSLPLSHAA